VVLIRALPLVLVACAAGDRALVEPPLRVRLASDPPYVLGDTTVEVQRAAFALADGLLRGPDGAVVGDWAHEDVVELTGGPDPLASPRLYEGDVTAGTFRLRGDPALDLRGVIVTAEGALVPFDLAPALDLEPALAVDVAPIDADDVRPLDWVLDLAVVLAPLDGTAPRGVDEPLHADGVTLDQLVTGLLAPGAWRLGERDEGDTDLTP
jgi:hypothetical protein